MATTLSKLIGSIALAPTVTGRSRDPQNLVEPRLFSFALHHEIHQATRLRYFLSLLCLTPDLPPSKATRPLLKRVARLSISRLRATDLATSLGGGSVRILLVDAETKNLPEILRRIKEGVESLARLTLSAGGACYPQTTGSEEGFVQQATDLMDLARAEGGDRLYLPS